MDKFGETLCIECLQYSLQLQCVMALVNSYVDILCAHVTEYFLMAYIINLICNFYWIVTIVISAKQQQALQKRDCVTQINLEIHYV